MRRRLVDEGGSDGNSDATVARLVGESCVESQNQGVVVVKVGGVHPLAVFLAVPDKVHKVLQLASAAMETGVEDLFNLKLLLAKTIDDRRRWQRLLSRRENIGGVRSQEGDVEHRMDAGAFREFEPNSRIADHVLDLVGTDPLVIKLVGGTAGLHVDAAEFDQTTRLVEFRVEVAPFLISVLAMNLLSLLKVLLGHVVGVTEGGDVCERSGNIDGVVGGSRREKGARSVGVATVVDQEGGSAKGGLITVVVSELSEG